MKTTFQRIAEAAQRAARRQRELDMLVKPHPYIRDPQSGAGNCSCCNRPEHFWAHWRSEP